MYLWLQGGMQEGGRDEVYDEWVQIFQSGTDNQRGRRWGHCECAHQGVEDRVDEHDT